MLIFQFGQKISKHTHPINILESHNEIELSEVLNKDISMEKSFSFY